MHTAVGQLTVGAIIMMLLTRNNTKKSNHLQLIENLYTEKLTEHIGFEIQYNEI